MSELQILDDLPPGMDECSVPGCSSPVKERTGGRGRPPTKCVEHTGKSTTGARAASVRGDKDTQLAGKAARVLAQSHAMMGLGIRLLGLPETAGALSDGEAGFIEAATFALETDPALCRQILSVGGKSSGLALMAAYAMLLSSVVPTAIEEVKAKRAVEDDA